MHTDDTLKVLDQVTVHIGAEFRDFSNKTCPAFDTRELKREAAARKCRQLKNAETQSKSEKDRPTTTTKQSEDLTRRKKFRIRSFKHHSLGDFPAMIRQFGTSDSFSTEPVSIRYSFA
jgi:hypothetical protein